MATGDDEEFAGGVEFGAGVAAVGSEFCKRGEDIQLRYGAGGFAQARGFRGDARAQVDKKLPLDFEDALVGGENFALVFLQFGRSEALGVDEGLLALVIVGGKMQVGLGDFNVVAEDVVEADFEGGDVGALALALFHGSDDLFAVLAEVAQLVELAVEAAADDAGIGGESGWIVGEGTFKDFADIGEFVDFVVEVPEKLAAASGWRHHEIFEDRKLREGFAQREEFARRG